jgi:hypothetical protein
VGRPQSEAGLNLAPAVEEGKRSDIRAALLAQAAVLRAQADTLDALAAALPDHDADALLDLGDLRRRFRLGRASVLGAVERGELQASRGPRGRILVRCSAAEAWLASRPVETRRPGAAADPATLDEWERTQNRELERVAGGR